MSYWLHWRNVRYEIVRQADLLLLAVARRLPARLRMWVVVDSAAQATFRDPKLAVTDLGYPEMYDGALRSSR